MGRTSDQPHVLVRSICWMLVVLLAAIAGDAARASGDELVASCGSQPNGVFAPYSQYGIEAIANCPGGDISLNAGSPAYRQGQNAIWQAVAPSGLTITAVWVTSLQSAFVNAGSAGQWGGDFYWSGGSSNIVPNEGNAVFSGLSTGDFGFQLVCGQSTCNGSDPANILVGGVVLTVHETTPPTLSAPSGLWDATGWIRGKWLLAFSGDSPSGMCSLTASLAGQSLAGSSSTPVSWQWHQCAAAPVTDPVDTASYPNGADALALGGTDAAGLPASATRTIDVDNQQPTISLTGPTVASSTTGTQYVTATATAGPSGVAGISCSVDGGPAQWYPASSAQVPVDSIGENVIRCFSENNAVDATGAHGVSPIQTFSMDIGTPTVSAITFSKLVDALRCRRVTERVRIPAHWVTVRAHGQVIRVRERAHSERVRVTKCHARTARRRRTVWVTVTRGGKHVRVRRSEVVRVVLLPHVVNRTRQSVPYGRATTVSGWLGTYNGQALGGQAVQILAAPDNGSGAFTPVATTTTAANGSWTVALPPGPSRLVEAQFGGGGTVLPALSTTVREVVPARIRLVSVSPRRVPWGGTVRLTGRLDGGYLPPGGALVRLRIGEGSAVTTYGVREHVGGSGRFSTTYTFGAGVASVHRAFWFQVATLPMGNYPYAPSDSRRVSVVVGGHPPVPRHRRHRRHHH